MRKPALKKKKRTAKRQPSKKKSNSSKIINLLNKHANLIRKSMIVIILLMLGIASQAFAQEAALKPTSTAEQEDKEFIKILNEIIAKSYSPSMTIDGTITPGSDCIADKGSVIRTNLLINNEMLFNLSDEGEDPNYAMSMQVAKKGLILHLDTTIGDNCTYHLDGSFFERKSGGSFEHVAGGTFREVGAGKGSFAKAELQLSFRIGFAGQLMHFRLRDIKSKLERFQKGLSEDEFEYTFHGVCSGDQELANFDSLTADLKLINNANVSTPVTGWYELEKCEIHFADGQFRIPLKVSSKMPTKKKK